MSNDKLTWRQREQLDLQEKPAPSPIAITKGCVVSIRFSAQTLEQLDALSARVGLSRANIVGVAVRDMYLRTMEGSANV